jgi:hypothetical protein
MSPHARVLAALAIIDKYNQLPPTKMRGIAKQNYDLAFDRLAIAMDDLYGPLPDAWWFDRIDGDDQ